MKKNWLKNQIVKLANAMLKPGFIMFFVGLIVVWILWNTLNPWRIDPWPFQGLNLLMSAIAGIQATIIGTAMAIHSEKTEKRDDQDHEVIMTELKEIKEIRAELKAIHRELLNRSVKNL